MKTKDLILRLQQIVDAHEPYIPVMGEHEIMIDVFEDADRDKKYYTYGGFSPDVQIDVSSDGVYHILSTFPRYAT